MQAFVSGLVDLDLEVALAKEVFTRLKTEIEFRDKSLKEA